MPKVLLLVRGDWKSFADQGLMLGRALESVGVKTKTLLVGHKNMPDLSAYKDYCMIPTSSWRDWDWLVQPLLDKGYHVLPWLVSDHEVWPEAVQKLNERPWFLTTSEYCKSIFVQFGVQPEKIRVLYECVDEDLWKPIPKRKLNRLLDYISAEPEATVALPPSFNVRQVLADDTPILYTLGGDATSKGALEIIGALHKLDPSIPWLWIVKTLPYESSFLQSAHEFAEAKELIPRIKYLTGEFSDTFLTELMNLCDIYIAVSRSEGFGLPLVEAQMSGKMLITHRSTSTAELLVEGETGLAADFRKTKTGEPHADIDSLAKILHQALTDKKLRQKLSANARPTAIKRFGKKAIGRQAIGYVNDFMSGQ